MKKKKSENTYEWSLQCIEGKETVDHPKHYQGKTLEVIDVIADFDLNFCLGNAIKYILRAGKKSDRIEDLKKAMWYLQKELG